MLALNPDVAGQSAQPFRSETAPHHETHEHGDQAYHSYEFSKFAHDSKSCANEAKAQAWE